MVTIEIEEDVTIEVDLTVSHLGSPPSWNEWDGGDPGDPPEFEVEEIRLVDEDRPLTKAEAVNMLGYTVEQFEERLVTEVDRVVAEDFR